ncbi:protein of unknown function [Latilactobacillus sakei]|nr:hypothetical protein LSAJ18_230049 [Latilactobacillus sakei]SOB44632.1 hypothetical protein LSAJ112_350017 [Latilactobacillus sakei]SON66069.1 protein of unknown function [Latilactobacillus sakei]SON72172.1 protein of unknown function [Latilactobacillus sakei]
MVDYSREVVTNPFNGGKMIRVLTNSVKYKMAINIWEGFY